MLETAIEVTIHGYPASYTRADGWRCREALVEKYLRETCTPGADAEHPSLVALTLAREQWPEALAVVERAVASAAEQRDPIADPLAE